MSNENVPIIRDLNGTRLKIASGGTFLEESGSLHLTSAGIGTPSADAALVTVEKIGTLHRTVITLTGKVVSTTDNTTSGAQGTLPLYTFPRGVVAFIGASTNLTVVGDGVGVAATAAVVGAIGSVVPATDATLTSTEADFVPSTTATLTASAGAMKGRGVTSKVFDNTTTTNATQLTANLNFAMPDAGTSANGTLTVSGTIELLWYNLGDN